MASSERSRLLAGLHVTSLGTLASRVLGMLRDAVTATLFGMSGGGVMDAFVVAFCLPNLFRRLFGEGALAASFLPVLSATLERDRNQAWKLVTVVLAVLAGVLALLLLASEVLCAVVLGFPGTSERTRLVVGLSAAMLPYLWFICLAAQVSAALQALGRFAAPAWAPVWLNVCWLAAAAGVAWAWPHEKLWQAYGLAGAVVLAGAAQLVCQWPSLRSAGFRWQWDLPAVRGEIRSVMAALGPMALGLAAPQISTLIDRWLAWSLTARDANTAVAWAPGWHYPLEKGAASAVYLGERLYELPQGLLGVAVATVVFPLLSRHAAQGRLQQLGQDLTWGLRLVVFLTLPASVGLMLLAEPTSRLLFEHGEFTARDTARTARVVAIYGAGVWAYCAMPVLVRGYYALGNRQAPLRIGLALVGLDLAANLLLVWPFAERGLAISTTLCACAQCVLLLALFPRAHCRLDTAALARSTARAGLATAAMAAGCLAIQQALSGMALADGTNWDARLLAVGIPLVGSAAVYAVASWALGAEEMWWLLGRRLD